MKLTRPNKTSLGPMSNSASKSATKSSCFWKLVAPTLEDESKTNTISAGLSPQTFGIEPKHENNEIMGNRQKYHERCHHMLDT